MNKITKLSGPKPHADLAFLQQRLPTLESAHAFIQLKDQVVDPYTKRAHYLQGKFDHILNCARTNVSDSDLRNLLGDKIIKDISGTWYEMENYAAQLRTPIPRMSNVREIVKVVLSALNSLFLQNDSRPVRKLAKRHFNLEVYPKPRQEPGRDKGISLTTRYIGEWVNEFYNSGGTDKWTNIAWLIYRDLQGKPTPADPKDQKAQEKLMGIFTRYKPRDWSSLRPGKYVEGNYLRWRNSVLQE